MPGRSRFLHLRGVLLGKLIHLVDGGVDLPDPGRLLARRCVDIGNDRIDLGDTGNDA